MKKGKIILISIISFIIMGLSSYFIFVKPNYYYSDSYKENEHKESTNNINDVSNFYYKVVNVGNYEKYETEFFRAESNLLSFLGNYAPLTYNFKFKPYNRERTDYFILKNELFKSLNFIDIPIGETNNNKGYYTNRIEIGDNVSYEIHPSLTHSNWENNSIRQCFYLFTYNDISQEILFSVIINLNIYNYESINWLQNYIKINLCL